jgi:hypothetical protein
MRRVFVVCGCLNLALGIITIVGKLIAASDPDPLQASLGAGVTAEHLDGTG